MGAYSRSNRAARASAMFFAALAAVGAGCLDVPIVHVEQHRSDAGDADASRPPFDASIDGPNACEACLRAPSRPGYGCGDPLDACTADPQCSGTIECSIAAGCFMLPSQADIIDCGTPCGRDAGLDVSSPSLQLVLAVVMCAQDVCGPICRGEVDAAVPEASTR
jgi:hypothetical protein